MEFSEALEGSINALYIGKVAKLIQQTGMKIGSKPFFQILRGDGLLHVQWQREHSNAEIDNGGLDGNQRDQSYICQTTKSKPHSPTGYNHTILYHRLKLRFFQFLKVVSGLDGDSVIREEVFVERLGERAVGDADITLICGIAIVCDSNVSIVVHLIPGLQHYTGDANGGCAGTGNR